MNSLNNTENTRNIIFYFQVHQPRRLQQMRFFDIGSGKNYFNNDLNREIIERIASNCYLKTNGMLLKLIRKHPNVKIAFSISGVTLEQFEEHTPEVIDSFRALAETGSVEFLAETYYHSLACMIPGHELEIQALKHADAIEKYFGKRPSVFRNTELIYNNDIGRRIAALGFRGIFTDGVRQVVNNSKSVNQIYRHPQEPELRIFLRNYMLSDDISFRFNQYGTRLTAEKYLNWLADVPAYDRVVNIAMDYETFGEHQKKDTGILDFFKKLVTSLSKNDQFRMLTPSEAIELLKPHSELSVAEHVSWADHERDLSAWLGNDMQKDAFRSLVELDKSVKATNNPAVIKQWRMLQTSDHFYYMSTKNGSDGNVHNYFSPYPSPYEAFINYMNTLTDFSSRLDQYKTQKPKRAASALPKIEELSLQG
jgi:alpha-amylase